MPLAIKFYIVCILLSQRHEREKTKNKDLRFHCWFNDRGYMRKNIDKSGDNGKRIGRCYLPNPKGNTSFYLIPILLQRTRNYSLQARNYFILFWMCQRHLFLKISRQNSIMLHGTPFESFRVPDTTSNQNLYPFNFLNFLTYAPNVFLFPRKMAIPLKKSKRRPMLLDKK